MNNSSQQTKNLKSQPSKISPKTISLKKKMTISTYPKQKKTAKYTNLSKFLQKKQPITQEEVWTPLSLKDNMKTILKKIDIAQQKFTRLKQQES